jgi:hypothetical protein
MTKKISNEDVLTKKVETETSRIPSLLFLGAAIGAMAVSASLKCMRSKDDKTALFFGQWVAPLLLMGIYNKIVKTNGHD